VVTQLFQSVNEMEQGLRSQYSINQCYMSLCNIIKSEMIENIPHKVVADSNSISNRKRKCGKHWWCDELTG
jgi:uncharacterized protein with PIN domain